MRNIYCIFLFFALLLFTSAGCKKDDDLTKATQTGANTFSCKINGKVFKPEKGNNLFAGEILYRYYDESSRVLGIGAKNLSGTPYKFLSMTIEQYHSEGTYDISNGNVNCEYSEDRPPKRFLGYSGYINITKDDQIKRILSGTFQFIAKDTSNIIINVTDGRFDIGY